MKKLLIINDIAYGGGVEQLMIDLISEWHSRYDITLLTTVDASGYKEVYPDDIKLINMSRKNFGTMRKKYHIQEMLKDIYWHKKLSAKKYDVVLAMKEGPITKFSSNINAGIKLAWVHLDYHNAYWTNAFYRSKDQEVSCLKKYKNIVCVSEYILNSIKDVIGDPGNLLVRYNPIDVDRIINNSKEPDDVSDSDSDKDILDNGISDKTKETDITRFVTIGRLHFQKGYDLLLDACRILDDRLQNGKDKYELIIVGGGPEEDDLRRKKDELKLDNVTMLGEKRNPHKYLKTADWYVSSSRYEGYSLVTQEACVLDIPIIATDVSGVRELLGAQSEYGIITDINAEKIADSMELVIRDRDRKLHEKYQALISERKKIINKKERIKEIEKLFD